MTTKHPQPEVIKDQTSFYLGLAIGIAVVSIIGFVMMSSAYFSKNDTSTPLAQEVNNVVKAPTPTAPTPTAPAPTRAIQPQGEVNVVVTASDHVRGSKNAEVTIVEYSDIQCPFCKRFHNTLRQVMDTYGTKVRWVYKHFPLDQLHPYARKAAEATECAADQGKFWEYLDYLNDNQTKINIAFLSTAATAQGLNLTEFNSCLNAGKYAAKVQADQAEGQKNGVTGTPGSIINGKFYKGALPFENLKQIIDAELK